jgi:formamidopyrimidine-DNA glycosylase
VPELPEVETTRRGISPHLLGRTITAVVVREPRLRWPVPAALVAELPGQRIDAVRRRGKYLFLEAQTGWAILHLGMSGSLRLASVATAPGPHEHVDLVIGQGHCLRLRDPRRFGVLLWTRDPPERHPLLAALGPEPWDTGFTGAYLYGRSRGRRVSVKHFIMDGHTVAGVGNIYANEALYAAGIRPARPAGRISQSRYERLVRAIREVLEDAIREGGTTLRDFTDTTGTPGYFAQRLRVYGRAGEPCGHCGTTVRQERLGQRSAYFCPRCQR